MMAKFQQTQSLQKKRLRAFSRVSREIKISNVRDLVTFPLQQNEIRQPSGRIRRVAHEHRRTSVHQSWNEMPVLEPGIVIEIVSHLGPTLPLKLCNKLEPHLIGEHVAYGIKIARVEALDISGKQRALGFCQNGWRNVVGLPCQLAQAGTAAMQRRLHGCN